MSKNGTSARLTFASFTTFDIIRVQRNSKLNSSISHFITLRLLRAITFLNLNIFYAVKTSKEVINKKGKNIYIFGIDLIILVIVSMLNYGGDMSVYKNVLAKIILLLLLVIPVAMFACGCQSNELSNRLFPMLAMVDKKDDTIEFAYIYNSVSQ